MSDPHSGYNPSERPPAGVSPPKVAVREPTSEGGDEASLTKIDVLERGAERDGAPQVMDRRLFMQLLAFDCATTHDPAREVASLGKALESAGVAGVIYEDVNAPRGLALLTWSEDPEAFVARVRPILAAPEPYGYRNKMEFTIAGEPATIGLHASERYDVVLDIERCLLQSDALNALLEEFRRQVRERALSVWDPETERGLLRFLMLREGRNTGEAMVNVVGAAPDVETLTPVAQALHARVPATASVVLNVNAKKASVAVGSEEHLLWGREHIIESLGGVAFQVSANSFFQTNTRQAERLFAIVEAACELDGTETLLDLYAGTGAISLLLARRVRAVYGIEVAAAAVADAIRNARANGIDNCTFLAGEVRHVLPDLMRQGVRASVVVADPPRAGFHPKALQALATLAPARIVYVSCNPATLARDVGDLVRHGYRLEWVQPVDMFPQTPHIEAVARLHRAA